MPNWVQIVLTAIGSIAASSGFWAYIQKRLECNDSLRRMILGLGHDRIMYLGMNYIERGDYITKDEYENLNDYLYIPYTNMKGNGSASRVMAEVNRLRIIPSESMIRRKENEIG